jgi:putative addiction module component (TIGR02574 family)
LIPAAGAAKISSMAVDSSLLQRSMEMPAEDRAELAERLLLSLDEQPADPDAECLWAEEIRRRQSDLHAGRATPVDWRDAVDRVRADLRGGQGK